MNILVVDIGGTNLKVTVTGLAEPLKIPSGPTLTAQLMCETIKEQTVGWQYEAVTLGYPGVVAEGRIGKEPVNLGPGWVGFDFATAFGKPVRILNDAAMQALGCYGGAGMMLFLGLGTGLGSCLIAQRTLVPMELGHLPYKKGQSFEDYVGDAGRRRLGSKKWHKAVLDVVTRLRAALNADYVVLGGGNVKKLEILPEHTQLGDNNNAFLGGFKLWEMPYPTLEPACANVL